MTEQATTTEQTTTTPAEQRPEPFARKPKNKLGNCECAQWEIGLTIDGAEGADEEPEVTIITTGCDKQTKRDFAQGHDAKLKSLFIRAGVEGMEVRWGRQTGVLVTTDAEAAAERFGFGQQVKAGILSRLDKLARGRKKIAPAPRAVAAEVVEGSEEGDLPTIPKAPAEQDTWTDEAAKAVDELLADPELAEMVGDEIKVQGKIGRWTYEGTVGEDGAFTYTGGSGETKVAEAGKWSPVAL